MPEVNQYPGEHFCYQGDELVVKSAFTKIAQLVQGTQKRTHLNNLFSNLKQHGDIFKGVEGLDLLVPTKVPEVKGK